MNEVSGASEILDELSLMVQPSVILDEAIEELLLISRPHLLLFKTKHGDTLGSCCSDIDHLEVIDDWLLIDDPIWTTEIYYGTDAIYCSGCSLPIEPCKECLDD